MDTKRQLNHRQYRSRDPLEKQLDKWFETGRQFVDGVSGTRPGKRNNMQSNSRKRFNNVGRWVGETIDWFFEEEEDWVESWELDRQIDDDRDVREKQPLQAISLRVPKAIAPSQEINNDLDPQDPWPDESSFRIERWKRPSEELSSNGKNNFSKFRQNGSVQRPLPKSSRRRN